MDRTVRRVACITARSYSIARAATSCSIARSSARSRTVANIKSFVNTIVNKCPAMGLEELAGFLALGTLLTLAVFAGLLLFCVAYVVLVCLLSFISGICESLCDRCQRGRRQRDNITTDDARRHNQ